MESKAGMDAVRLAAAMDFAARKHRDQRRNDTEATPYINHPIAVAALLARVVEGVDLATLQAAVLHDTVEDTATNAEELDVEFGPEVRSLVLEVTDDKRLAKADRKRLQIEHAPHLSPRARCIKLADKICNLGDMSHEAPAGWSVSRKTGLPSLGRRRSGGDARSASSVALHVSRSRGRETSSDRRDDGRSVTRLGPASRSERGVGSAPGVGGPESGEHSVPSERAAPREDF